MNILVIRTHRLGDILQLTPMLEGLKAVYPGSRTYFLTGEEFTPLLEGNRHVDALIPIPEREYRYYLKSEPERYAGIFNEIYDLTGELKRQKFDLIINRQYEWGGLLASLVGAPRIVGGAYSPERGFYFDDQPSKDLFDAVKKDRKSNRRNLVDWACRIAGLPPGNHGPLSLSVGQGARREAEQLTGAGDRRPIVGVQMGAAKSFRQWGAHHFAKVIDWLIREKQRRVVLIGSEDERELSEPVERVCKGREDDLVNLMGKTSLTTTGAVLERCELLITGDTGPMHMAAAVGTPVLSLFFGTAYPCETGPYGCGHFILYSDLPCAPCLDPARCESGHACKGMITPPVVMRAFETFEAFRSGEPVGWKCPDPSVRLLATSRDARGEQVLLPPEEVNGIVPESDRLHARTDDGRFLPDVLRAKGDEIVLSCMEGEVERGFASFPDYLNQWLALTGALTEKVDLEAVRGLLRECLEAVQGGDTVSLMDAVEYGFKPLLERAACDDPMEDCRTDAR
ncbi:MAG: glycosyltransferase family 9 protein [Deltaproteobacteria bacterium]|nr:glycosyltransferase family 9 protein [Deltaproteobacteria bacterium]